MTATHYDLKFTIASRTIFSKRLKIVHWDAFQKAGFSDFAEKLPPAPDGPFDGFMVHSVEMEGPIAPVSRRGGQLLYVAETYPRYLTRFEGTFEDFLQGMSGKSRSTLRRKVRKFAKADGGEEIEDIDWRQYDTPEEIADFLDQAVPLAERTYQARLFDGALPDTAAFRDEALALAREGRLRAYLLFLNSRPVAYLYTPLEGRTYVYAYLGYDEAEANLSPGTVLQFLVHEKLFEEKPADWFDFTEGEGAHKSLFSSEVRHCATVMCLHDTLGNRFLVWCHRLWNRTVEGLKALADKADLTARVRRIFR